MTQVTTAPAGRISLAATLAFAATHIPIAALSLAIVVHMPRYFASTLGMGLALVGSTFALVRTIDIPLDPMLGLTMDRTRSRFGRYRLWTVLGVPLMIGGLYMLIHARPGMGQLYLAGWLLVMYLGLSVLLLSNLAWAACLATSYGHRSRIFGVFTALGVLGAIGVLIIPVVAERLGYTDGDGVRAMLWFIIAATPVCAFLVVFRTPEPVSRDHVHGQFALKDYWSLLTRGNVLRLVAADLCVNLGPLWMAAIYLFFFKDSRGFTFTQANLLLLIYIAAGFVGAPFTAWLANKAGKHRALMVNSTVYSLTLLSVVVVPKGDFLLATPTMFITGCAAAGLIVVIRALAGDIADEIRLESGREWMGLMFAMTNATGKVASAASIFLTFNVLEQIGYNAKAGAVNTPAAIRGLELAFLIGPIFFLMLGGACFIGYKLSAERHADIRRQLDARDAASDAAAALESLTGEPV